MIAHDHRIAEKCFHIIADDRPIAENVSTIAGSIFQRSGDRERSYGN